MHFRVHIYLYIIVHFAECTIEIDLIAKANIPILSLFFPLSREGIFLMAQLTISPHCLLYITRELSIETISVLQEFVKVK